MATSRKRLRSTGGPDLYNLMEELQTLRHQNESLSSKVEAMTKRPRNCGKHGTPSWRYLMNLLQRFFNEQERSETRHATLAPGHPSRKLLSSLVNRWMTDLDDLSRREGYDWRKVPDR